MLALGRRLQGIDEARHLGDATIGTDDAKISPGKSGGFTGLGKMPREPNSLI
jgi:hypothetical protein